MKAGRQPFDNRMTRLQSVLGWIYVPFHIFVLPLLLGLYAYFNPDGITEAGVNLAYYGAGTVFVLLVMRTYLRAHWDVLLDHFGRCVAAFLMAMALTYALTIGFTLLLMVLNPDLGENPNNAGVMEMAEHDYGVTAALAVFIGPMVEETLFRGVVFGTLRRKSAIAAYALSMLLFPVYHIWQFVLVTGDPAQFVYALQYVPVAFALCFCYERGGSIWTCIFFHMGYNGLAFAFSG